MIRVIKIGDLAKVMGREVDEVIRATKIALFNGVIRDTRVDTGRLRGNWQTTTGYPAGGDLERLDPTGAAAMQDVMAGVKPDTVDFLTNNLPYAEVWEERDGMVARNAARIERNLKEAVNAQN